MQIRTQHRNLRIGHRQPVVSVAVSPKSSSGYLVVGIALGLVVGFVIGTLVTFVAGDKSLLFIQHLWDRIFNVDADGERVHFELLLQ